MNTKNDVTSDLARLFSGAHVQESLDRGVTTVVPVVLAGGAGTRLWPISREHHPKQLASVIGDETLLAATLRRASAIAAKRTVATPLVVCGEEHRHVTTRQLTLSGLQASIVLEPARRDTAPALSIAAELVRVEHGDAVLVVMPADHTIDNVESFHRALDLAIAYAQLGCVATLGIVPSRADPGFGYLRLGESVRAEGVEGGMRLDGFVEKPAPEIASQYIEAGNYLWNSGIYVVRASVWLAAIAQFAPDIHSACERSVTAGTREGTCFRPARDAFDACPSDSIDYAVMEKLADWPEAPVALAVPLDAGWSDLGSWSAVWEALDKDTDGNAGRGRVMFEGATGCYAHSEGRLVACVGVTNVAVVETADAVLVVDRAHVQAVKSVVGRIASSRAPEATSHRLVRRPWGWYDSIDRGERFQVKRILVDPGASLSLQMHHHRAEHWTVVRGTAMVTRGDERFLLSENESTYIPVGVTHRLENPGRLPLEMIEVQSGSYLGEDDIVRFDDTYGRV
ncbi:MULTISPECIES: mannose-1-phosphate guanylyltransferase/mannose-6-phosphate isomerase [Paraburkholderia]|uniref:mannose-1-phosphate guanylyltransferase n=1 Tax=Paraburkholderia dioscoreae TaxID=2604047 RepID=A0A5Q4Z3R7_9BURK|nr:MULTISPECIES: mannose-1-phosphate guanylyltransferase/mannose-6-phosphate isomerase [Paraburkholderia]MDR8396436.1 mannose-1-phosphate guanylyltransferase/mannose-6-phosphate isomerase [Paraburkholderia sp. USG1]VVD34196.1 mannose-1-phosphate guanyltransferase [Paraburkholderia dioscoreae]